MKAAEPQTHHNWRFNHQFHGGLDRELKQERRFRFCDTWVQSESASHIPVHTSISRDIRANDRAEFRSLFHQEHIDKQPPTLLLNASVQCASYRRELSSMNDSPQSVTEQFGACAPGRRTSFNNTSRNISRSTSLMALEWKQNPITGCIVLSMFFATVTTFWETSRPHQQEVPG